MKPLFFEPVFQDRIWGGTRLKSFGYDIPSNITGECWAISAHPNGPSIIANGEFNGKSLAELWEHNRELFGNLKGEKFPLLTKILDANDDLSVQVHPSDEYAKVNENGELGKTECWYIIDCDEEAQLIFGHHATSKEELDRMIDEGNWNNLLRIVNIKKGDFFFVPSGTVHALCKGTLVLETQQNSDTTYRLFDYNRKDAGGNTRELHLEKSKDVITVPFNENQLAFTKEKVDDAVITYFVTNEYFTVNKIDVNGAATFIQSHPFLLASVIEGEGKLISGKEESTVKKGDHFMLPADFGEYTLQGNIELIISHI